MVQVMETEACLGGDGASEGRSVRAASLCSNKSTKRKKAHRKKKAKEWTYYIETLKSTMDCLYEICRGEQSTSGCKEALMYIQNGERDFQSLIEVIRLEQSYTKEEPHSVAWGLRKSMTSPTRFVNDKGAQVLMDVLPISPMVMADASLPYAAVVSRSNEHTQRKEQDGDGWKVVCRRRRSNTSTISDVLDAEYTSVLDDSTEQPPRPQSVYERLSSSGTGGKKRSSRFPVSPTSSSRILTRGDSLASKLKCPKSAMDLPQTKASMAKISYCRQQIWEKSIQPSLAEKFRVKQKREKERPTHGTYTGNAPSSARCGLNFTKSATSGNGLLPPIAKKTTAGLGNSANRETRSLQSICESSENGDLEATSPVVLNKQDISARSEPPCCVSPASLLGLDMENDREWREMTEEEESLAMEDMSIKLEIEKAESEIESIDSELARHADVDAGLRRKPRKVHHYSSAAVVPVSSVETTPALKYEDMVHKMQEEFKTFCQESWSDIVEKEFAGRYREPGMLADRHEMLSSPNKRRCDKDDVSHRQAEKLRKADEVRERLLREKKQKLVELAHKRADLLKKQSDLDLRKRTHLEMKMAKAQENREKSLSEIKRKAKEDETKVQEVQYINSMNDCHRRIDLKNRDANVKKRKLSLEKERAKKAEEKVAKEHAVEERRRCAEQERLSRFLEKDKRREAIYAKMCPGKCEEEKLLDAVEVKADESALATDSDASMTELSHFESISFASLRPSAEDFAHPLHCQLCDSILLNELECVAHVTSEIHLNNAGIDPAVADEELLHNELRKLTTASADHADWSHSTRLPSRARQLEAAIHLRRSSCAIIRGVDNSASSPPAQPVPKLWKDLCFRLTKWGSSVETGQAAILKKVDRTSSEVVKKLQNKELTSLGLGDTLLETVDVMLAAVYRYSSFSARPEFVPNLVAILKYACEEKKFLTACLYSERFVDILENLARFELKDISCPNVHHIFDLSTYLIRMAKESSIEDVPHRQPLSERLRLMSCVVSDMGLAMKSTILDAEFPPLPSAVLASLQHFVECLSSPNKNLSFASSLLPSYLDTMCSYAVRLIRSCTLQQYGLSTEHIELLRHILCVSCFSADHIRKEVLSSPTRSLLIFILLAEHVEYLTELSRDDSLGFDLDFLCSVADSIGYFASVGGSQQMMCRLGGASSLVSKIARLPLKFMTMGQSRISVLSCLILVSYQSMPACEQIAQHLSMKYMVKFLEAVFADSDNTVGLHLSRRLLQPFWKEAVKYYSSFIPKPAFHDIQR